MLPETGTKTECKQAVLDCVETLLCPCGRELVTADIDAWRSGAQPVSYALPVFRCPACDRGFWVNPIGYEYYRLQTSKVGVIDDAKLLVVPRFKTK